jgi:flagellar biosynthesis protein FlhF
MIIKRYIVDNMNEAMVKIRYELGSDAVIVSQRKLPVKGIKGLFKPRKLEVTAASDDRKVKKTEAVPAEDNTSMHSELSELKSMLKEFISSRENGTDTSASSKRPTKNSVKQHMIERDIPPEILDKLCQEISNESGDKKITAKYLEKELYSAFESMIHVSKGDKGRIQALVGPTGVGKTTTIAKLASINKLYNNKKVGLITLDTYRIGAVDQLKSYAEILDVPFGVVLSLKDIPSVKESMADCDIIFIDTTGRNSKNIMQLSELKRYLQEFQVDITHLVLSMTTKHNDLKQIIKNYRLLDFNSMILTKNDETTLYGSLATAIYYGKTPIAYITTGQSVPEDIEEAEAEKILHSIMGAEN